MLLHFLYSHVLVMNLMLVLAICSLEHCYVLVLYDTIATSLLIELLLCRVIKQDGGQW